MAELEPEDELRINTGVVKSFNGKKGFGFIIPDDGTEELFVHYTSILCNGFRSLMVGEKVEFAIYFGCDSRTSAVDVTVTHPLPRRGGYWYNFIRGGGNYGYRGLGKKACFHCGEEGHRAMNCHDGASVSVSVSDSVSVNVNVNVTRSISGTPGRGKRGGCFKCGEKGHFKRECPNGGAR